MTSSCSRTTWEAGWTNKEIYKRSTAFRRKKRCEHFKCNPAPCAGKPSQREKRQELSILLNMGTLANFQKGWNQSHGGIIQDFCSFDEACSSCYIFNSKASRIKVHLQSRNYYFSFEENSWLKSGFIDSKDAKVMWTRLHHFGIFKSCTNYSSFSSYLKVHKYSFINHHNPLLVSLFLSFKQRLLRTRRDCWC